MAAGRRIDACQLTRELLDGRRRTSGGLMKLLRRGVSADSPQQRVQFQTQAAQGTWIGRSLAPLNIKKARICGLSGRLRDACPASCGWLVGPAGVPGINENKALACQTRQSRCAVPQGFFGRVSNLTVNDSGSLWSSASHLMVSDVDTILRAFVARARIAQGMAFCAQELLRFGSVISVSPTGPTRPQQRLPVAWSNLRPRSLSLGHDERPLSELGGEL